MATPRSAPRQFINDIMQEAGRRLHRRSDGASGQAHGSRRRDHLGWQGRGRRTESPPSRGEHRGRGDARRDGHDAREGPGLARTLLPPRRTRLEGAVGDVEESVTSGGDPPTAHALPAAAHARRRRRSAAIHRRRAPRQSQQIALATLREEEADTARHDDPGRPARRRSPPLRAAVPRRLRFCATSLVGSIVFALVVGFVIERRIAAAAASTRTRCACSRSRCRPGIFIGGAVLRHPLRGAAVPCPRALLLLAAREPPLGARALPHERDRAGRVRGADDRGRDRRSRA